MAWTDPATWTVGELVLASKMNTHVRDNLNSTNHLLAYKSADESLASNTTLQDDDHLFFAMAAGDIWHVQVGLHLVDGSGAADWKIAFTVPSGSIMLQTVGYAAAGSLDEFRYVISGTSPGSPAGRSAGSYLYIVGTANNGVTAGNFRVQWAQNTSNATAITVKKGSTITGMKLA